MPSPSLTGKARLPIRDMILFGFWPSPLKRLIYRLKGYRIGRGVSFGFGSVLLGEDVEVGDETEIGFLTVVRGKKIRIGAYVQIGSMTILDAPLVEIGEGTKINEQVFVGGLQFPDSKFVVGRNCQIMQMTFINPTHSVVIGDDSGIGGHCLLFGHTTWLSQFEGYPVDFDSIEIGKSVSVSWRVFLLPGTRIGDGSIIGANSLVRGSIPARSLAMGFPARVVSAAPEFPRQITDPDRAQILLGIANDLLAFLRGYGFGCHPSDSWMEVQPPQGSPSPPDGRHWRYVIQAGLESAAPPPASWPRLHAVVSLKRIPAEVRRVWETRGTLWIDIESKERAILSNPIGEELVQFLRRYGVRFDRQPALNGDARPKP
jgi:acetyltransferase-like isoleucine patch superfamily enzyme